MLLRLHGAIASLTACPRTAGTLWAKLSIADTIAAIEKLRADEIVLDVSFESNAGEPTCAVRTYANGKVSDCLVDGITGAAIGDGSVTVESATLKLRGYGVGSHARPSEQSGHGRVVASTDAAAVETNTRLCPSQPRA
jgi:hypothetical protein